MSTGFYSRKVDFPNIPWMEAVDASNWPKNDLGQLVYRARNSDIERGVIYNKYYWVDENKNHIPFFTNELEVGTGSPISTPGTDGPFLYLDSSNGALWSWDGSSWVQLSGGNTNIYNSDGTLAGNRVVAGGGFNLSFDNLVRFTASGTVVLSTTPATVNTNDSFLTRNSLTGEVELRDISSFPSNDTNFATTDLFFTANRIHDGGNFGLTLTNISDLNFNTTNTTFSANTELKLSSDIVTLVQPLTLANTNSTVLVRDTITGEIKERAASTLTNFTISDGTNTSLIAGGDTLLFNGETATGPLTLSVNGDNVYLDLNTAGFTVGQVLGWDGVSLTNTTPSNIYNANGTLLNNRVVNGSGFNLSFQGMTTFTARGEQVVLEAETDMIMITPNVFNALATNGQVLTLTDAINGVVEFADAGSGSTSVPLEVLDEGVSLTATTSSINFVGAGVTSTNVGTDVLVTIAGTSTATPVVEYLPIAVPTSTITAAQPINTNYLATIFRNGVRDNAIRIGQTWTFSPSIITGEIIQIEYYT